MHVQDSYPIIVTDRLTECRDFYLRWLGFRIVFEATWFVYLASAGDRPYGIAFMAADHPSQPPGPETFTGRGVFLTLQVADAAEQFERFREAGAPVAYPLRDEPWGQRRFALIDPAGVWIDVVQHIDPEPGYWDQYMPSGASAS
jgi:catechol 2,3-dioxygenase-like lactoylglutathione lyase family enzyme